MPALSVYEIDPWTHETLKSFSYEKKTTNMELDQMGVRSKMNSTRGFLTIF